MEEDSDEINEEERQIDMEVLHQIAGLENLNSVDDIEGMAKGLQN